MRLMEKLKFMDKLNVVELRKLEKKIDLALEKL
jgi:hypothetical protein